MLFCTVSDALLCCVAVCCALLRCAVLCCAVTCSLAAAQQDPNCLLLAGCMDGSVHILHAATGRVLASAKPHSKYVVGADWAPVLVTTSEGQQQQQQQQQEGAGTVRQAGEQLIATASYDSSCCVLRVVPGGSSSSSSSGSSAAQGPEEGAGAQQQLSLEVVQQVSSIGSYRSPCSRRHLAGLCYHVAGIACQSRQMVSLHKSKRRENLGTVFVTLHCMNASLFGVCWSKQYGLLC
jgi:hypothetical protein